MSDCLFCKFINKEMKPDIVYENDSVLGFKDINPQAKEHYLFISKTHSKNINDMNDSIIVEVMTGIKEFTQSNSLENDGFRIVTNIGQHGCQSVFHTHFHVLGGEQLAGFGR